MRYPIVEKVLAGSFHPGPFVKPGDRIELLKMENDPDPIAPGTRGTVKEVNQLNEEAQIMVDWDNGRKLMLAYPYDKFKIVEK
jgi:hypothetical protein